MHWQVQEAKQRFSELLRAVDEEGLQYVTKHGKEVAVVVSIDEFHRLTGEGRRYNDLTDWLLNGPKIDLPDDEFDALFERSHEPDTRETPFVGPSWE